MPPGMTMCPVASISCLAESAGNAPGVAIAAIVSPAIATSQRTTPSGVTTSPPRIMRSNIPPGDELTELRGRAGKRLAAYLGKLCSHHGIAKGGVDLAIELIDDLDRRPLRSGHAVPLARFVTRYKIFNPRQV